MKRLMRCLLALSLLATSISFPGPIEARVPSADVADPGTAEGRFKGVSLVMVGPAGQLDFMKKAAQKWADQSGAQVRVDEIPFGEINDKTLAALSSNVYLGDVINIGSGLGGDLMGGAFVLPVPEWAKARAGWDDIFEVFRKDALSWSGTDYALPWGGDELDYFFRRDAFDNPTAQSDFKAKYGRDLAPARTWAEYAQIAEFFTGADLNGKGQGYGLVELPMRKNQGWNGFMTRATAYAKAPDDPGFFFDPATMQARINNPGFVKALEDWKAVQKFGPPGMQNFGWIENAQAFAGGLAAQDIQWPSIVPMTHDPAASIVAGKVGYALTPGVDQYWDSRNGTWVTPSSPNRATFLGFGGWINMVPSSTRNAAAAFDLAAYLGSAEVMSQAVVTPGTGMNPSRGAQLDLALWQGAGFSAAEAQAYIDMITGALSDQNAVFDLRLPGFPDYKDVLEVAVSKALADQDTAQNALDEAARSWEATTDRLGRDSQRTLYRQSLGLPG